MFINESPIKRKIRQASLFLFNKLENNGNSDFYTNGEKRFIDHLFETFTATPDQQKILFDIGANIGNYTEMMMRKAKNAGIDAEFHLFEPTQSCHDILSEKFGNNNTVVLNPFGVSDRAGTTTIYYDKEKSGFASLYRRNLDSYRIKMDRSEEITIKRLDTYIQEKNIEHIHFVKMDIEGHELKAMEGFGNYMNGNFIDYIQFEYGGANLDSHTCLMDIYQFLEERGFNIAKIMPKGLVIRKYQPWMDNFHYANYVAVSTRIA